MNRRAFTKRILAGGAALWVPHVLAAPPPLMQRVISRPSRTVSASGPTLKLDLGSSGSSTATFGQDSTTDLWAAAGSFTSPSSFTLSHIIVYLRRLGTSASICSCVLHAAGAEPGAEIATSDTTVVLSSLDTTAAPISFYFSGVSLVGSTQYWMALWSDAINASNYFRATYKSTGSEAVDNSTASRASPTWSSIDSASEFKMQVYGF